MYLIFPIYPRGLIYPTYACERVSVCVCVQLDAAKKAYFMACKEEKLASMREANSKAEASMTADQQKKLHEKVDKCKQDSQKVRTRRRRPVGTSSCKGSRNRAKSRSALSEGVSD